MNRPLLLLPLLFWLAPGWAQGGVLPRYGGELRVALPAAPSESDPARVRTPSDLQLVHALHATLLELDSTGTLRPALLAALPEAEPGGRAYRLRLRPGLRFHDGSPLTALDVAASLARLSSPQLHSPSGWISLVIQGSDAVMEGRSPALSGVQIVAETELRVVLGAPFADFPRLLAYAPASIVPSRGSPPIGAGPFRLAERSGASWRLVPFDSHHRGRPYLDSVSLSGLDRRRISASFASGDIDLVLRPEPLNGHGARQLPALTVTYAVVNGDRLGEWGSPLRNAFSSLDRTELIRFYVGGQAAPLTRCLPPAIPGGELPVHGTHSTSMSPGAPSAPLSKKLVLLVPQGAESLRPVADRIQVKLFDLGYRLSVQSVSPETLAVRLASRDFDLAITSLSLVSDRPIPAALEVAWNLGGPRAAKQVLAGANEGAGTFSRLEEELHLIPLFVRGWRATGRVELQGLTPIPDGSVELGDLWLLPRAPLPERSTPQP